MRAIEKEQEHKHGQERSQDVGYMGHDSPYLIDDKAPAGWGRCWQVISPNCRRSVLTAVIRVLILITPCLSDSNDDGTRHEIAFHHWYCMIWHSTVPMNTTPTNTRTVVQLASKATVHNYSSTVRQNQCVRICVLEHTHLFRLRWVDTLDQRATRKCGKYSNDKSDCFPGYNLPWHCICQSTDSTNARVEENTTPMVRTLPKKQQEYYNRVVTRSEITSTS